MDDRETMGAADDNPDSASIRCFLVDDHVSVLEALTQLLEADGMAVVGRARSGATALAESGDSSILVVTDFRLPDMSGLDLARRLLRSDPDRHVVVYTAVITARNVGAAIEIGVRGVVLKDSLATELPIAIRRVAAGGTYFDAKIDQRPT